ncbi:MAG: glycosyltransferase family 2 protein [Lachnospiraceae bacterium]|nr:glycosyltransferase family 2 protein [Lachnospiraceae bacterium]
MCQQQTEKKSPAVSVIVPVYNVSPWLDECMESVVNQTFSDFEVILVDDGSTDDSGDKCERWEEKDRRIKVIHKENEGPSKARNLGIQEAKGTYLVFLDGDDWLDSRFLELLYGSVTETDADMAECDVYRVNSETGTKTYRVCSGDMGCQYSKKERMKYGYTSIWKCMFKKEIFVKNGIVFPDCHSEARAVYALLVAVSNRVESVTRALYYYRVLRKGSLTAKPRSSGEDENTIGIQALAILLQNFKNTGLYEPYEKTLQEIVKLKLSDLLSMFFYRKEKSDYLKLAGNYRSFIRKMFPDALDYRYITWGGYNLNRIVSYMNFLHDPYGRFNFSSLISLMNPVEGEFSWRHKNRYREIMVRREIRNQFWDILEEMAPHYLILDFIEERFDIAVFGNGYLTISDAFDGTEGLSANGEIIGRETEGCRQLWEQSCKQFIGRLEKQCPSMGIILVKNYLSEKMGDIYSQEEYPNLEEIRRVNRILKGYYDYFERNCKAVKVVEASKGRLYFTDRQYEYGAIPSHLNEIVNREIAGMVERCMKV